MGKKSIFKAQCSVVKVDEPLGIVFGWGMITDVDGEPYYDLDNLHIDSELMMKGTSEFMETERISNDSHTENDIGIVIHSFPLTPETALAMGVFSKINGWMVGVKPDKENLEKYASGEYKGFSIEGEGIVEDEE
jgi:hypothetical protein